MKNPAEGIKLPEKLGLEVAAVFDELHSYEQLTEMFMQKITAKMTRLRKKKCGLKKKVCDAAGIKEEEFDNYHIERTEDGVTIRYCEGCAEHAQKENAPNLPTDLPPDIKSMMQEALGKIGLTGVKIGMVEMQGIIQTNKPKAKAAPAEDPKDDEDPGIQTHSA